MRLALLIPLTLCLTACLSPAEEKTKRQNLILPPPPAQVWPKESWHLFGEHGINIIPAWEITKGSKDVTIAIIDQDFIPNNGAFSLGKCHAQTTLASRLGEKLKPSDHGGMVASVISTCENNPLELVGINQYSSVLWVEKGLGHFLSDIELLRWSAGDPTICQNAQYIKCSAPNGRPAQIINMSFSLSVLKNELAIFRRIFLAAVIKARDLGSILVAAAGNQGVNAERHFPASATGVISSGFTTIHGTAHGDSNWGEVVEIMAPGQSIPVAYGTGKIAADGSSFAAPMVTGVISLMRSVDPSLNWKTAVYFLQSTATPMDCHAYCIANRTPVRQAQCKQDCCIGNEQTCTPGRMDAGAAVKAAQKASIEGPPPVALVDSDNYWIELALDEHEKFAGQFRLFNVGGQKGIFEISSPDGVLQFNGNSTIEIELAQKGKAGDSVLIQVNALPPNQNWQESAIHIKSPESGHLSTFSDEITIYAGIVKH